ncbi:MAG: 16S rRNA (cytosine(1402)-N(4))-methyltransferase RsmH [Saprospiraceae bacterium]|nr:16S rRNA (cytosine(1402)-N(4))-methyltransferase RsmH [Bacteroidia bacterium]MBT8268796.1 16S rRNA (cytosine(1402)-N(4))-methyltransferase RsmH [Bacteroidia bacterium]NNK90079.1 16S rRNA (cytosine(1402)-N(4))-methyltransferase RsmH [Saprospiraceae bacterium]
MSEFHDPVLLRESVDALVQNADGLYMDLTFGGGGHSKEILERLSPKGGLIVFDQDVESGRNIIKDERLVSVKANFRYLYRFWKWLEIDKVDGILADLGVSSHQFDADYRGFSYRYEAPLDMRMNEESELTAADLLNNYSSRELQDIFSRYGEVRNAKTLAGAIVSYREDVRKIESTFEFNKILEKLAFGDRIRYFSQVYQALRIEVNHELEALEDMLEDSLKVMKTGGRLVVISYHSLEDRIVKRFIKTGSVKGELKKDDYGRVLSGIRALGKLILPTEEEQKINSRSRSAKMRIGLKI